MTKTEKDFTEDDSKLIQTQPPLRSSSSNQSLANSPNLASSFSSQSSQHQSHQDSSDIVDSKSDKLFLLAAPPRGSAGSNNKCTNYPLYQIVNPLTPTPPPSCLPPPGLPTHSTLFRNFGSLRGSTEICNS